MYTAAVAAEYNPFHNGHKYHLEATRKAGATHIMCVMSGNFVQRGEAAICDKFSRAEMAVRGGADLVVELPLNNAVSGAGFFADGAVEIMALSGVVNAISFGCSENTDRLISLSEALNSENIKSKTAEIIKTDGSCYPSATEAALKVCGYQFSSEMLRDANNILACEYITSARKLNFTPDFIAIERSSCIHDSSNACGNIASAKHIRTLLNDGNSEKGITAASKFVPSETAEILGRLLSDGDYPLQKELFEAAVLSRLQNMTADDFTHINNVNQGLENKLLDAIKTSYSLNALYINVKSKRFTHSRIRQVVLSSALGVTREKLAEKPAYIRILAFNENGRELIRYMNKLSFLPIITNASDAKKYGDKAIAAIEADARATRLYNLCKKENARKAGEFDIHPFSL